MTFSIYDFVFAGLAAVAAGFINALAGGGTLITFPVLTAIGLPAVSANITNTIALSPGYLSATLAQMNEIKKQKSKLLFLIILSVLGGITGGILLLHSGEKTFRQLVPFLILLASVMLAIQPPIRKWVAKRSEHKTNRKINLLIVFLLMFPAAIYGGYFGAGVSVIILAVLGLLYDDSLTSLNALKQAMSFSINVSAAIFFLFSGQVQWFIALVMAIGAILGGAVGGKLSGKIKPAVLRWIVVTIGLIVGIIYLFKIK